MNEMKASWAKKKGMWKIENNHKKGASGSLLITLPNTAARLMCTGRDTSIEHTNTRTPTHTHTHTHTHTQRSRAHTYKDTYISCADSSVIFCSLSLCSALQMQLDPYQNNKNAYPCDCLCFSGWRLSNSLLLSSCNLIRQHKKKTFP